MSSLKTNSRVCFFDLVCPTVSWNVYFPSPHLLEGIFDSCNSPGDRPGDRGCLRFRMENVPGTLAHSGMICRRSSTWHLPCTSFHRHSPNNPYGAVVDGFLLKISRFREEPTATFRRQGHPSSSAPCLLTTCLFWGRSWTCIIDFVLRNPSLYDNPMISRRSILRHHHVCS